MKAILFSLLTLALVATISANRQSYEGYHLLHVFPETAEQVDLLQKLESNPDFDVWNNAKGLRTQVDVCLSPTAFLTYSEMFKLYNLKFEVAQQNVQNLIDEQERSNLIARSNSKSIVGTFASYAQIQDFIRDTEKANPSIASIEKIGNSHEKRELNVIKFKTPTSQRKIWIDCGIHARERISVATCIYLIDYITKSYNNNDADIKELLSYYEINILPLVNPDGYNYAQTTQALWRKNRKVNPGTSCIGVDLNRNYGYKWMVGGASNNPCSDTFAGPSADSEPETQAIQKYIMKENNLYDSFLTIHTYGLWWFTPWGYSSSELPSDYTELLDKVKIAKDAIKKSLNNKGSNYVIGSSAQILYVAAGGSDDWAKGVAKIKHSCTLELRPGQSGVDANYGFLLPADRIPDTGAETTAGIVAYLKAIKNDASP